MTIRHPVALLQSAFLQQLKRDNVGAGGGFGRPVFCCTMDEWMAAELDRDVKHHLEYADTVMAYVDQFGIDRVHVLVYEDLCADSQAFFTRVCEILEVSASEGLNLIARERHNTRWTQHQLDALETIQNEPLRSLMFRLSPRSWRRAMLGLDLSGVPSVVGPKARVAMSKKWLARVTEMTREGNEWLARTFDLPLERYGYFDS
jgi:hypothetical protein